MRVKANQSDVKKSSSPAIIGTYEGEALDANITNKNGLDITVEVMQTVLESEDYKDGIEHGWFIGFLGHPEDPGCQDFKEGCIVMTDMWIDDDNKVHAKFNLLNTPVGQIVKTYIDAGVVFGISIRGAGDIIDNSVDPETFVFRGFDLVAFPAYPESIPTFSEIAASTDIADQKKYQRICAAVKKNLASITSASTLEVLKSQFAKQSDVYKALDAREKSLKKVESKQTFNIGEQRFDSIMSLYLESVKACQELQAENEQLRRSATSIKASNRRKLDSTQRQIESIQADSKKKLESVRRITASQISDLESENDELQRQIRSLETQKDRIQRDADARVSSEVKRVRAESESEIRRVRSESNSEIESVKASMQKRLSDARTSLDSVRASNERLKVTNSQLSKQVDTLKNSNLIYKQQIDASTEEIASKDSIISDLKSKLRETVTASTDAKTRTSNLDAENEGLRHEIEMCRKMLREYQDAYASMYAASLGINPDGISVNDDMSVSEMRKTISSATNTMNIGVTPRYTGCEDFDDSEDYNFYGDYDVDGMVTM